MCAGLKSTSLDYAGNLRDTAPRQQEHNQHDEWRKSHLPRGSTITRTIHSTGGVANYSVREFSKAPASFFERGPLLLGARPRWRSSHPRLRAAAAFVPGTPGEGARPRWGPSRSWISGTKPYYLRHYLLSFS